MPTNTESGPGDADNPGPNPPRKSPTGDQEEALEAAWKISPQRASLRRDTLIIFGAGFVLSAISFAVYFFYEIAVTKSTIWVAIAYIALVITALASSYQRAEKRRQFEVEYSLSQLAEENAEQDSVELAALWKANKSQLGHYHKIVMNYAESSKRSTQWYLLGGFVFVLAAGVMTLFATRTDTAIGTTVIAASAAALTGFIAKAVLRNDRIQRTANVL